MIQAITLKIKILNGQHEMPLKEKLERKHAFHPIQISSFGLHIGLLPASAPARFGTWFFVAAAPIGDSVRIDDSEIKEHQWMSPQRALKKHCAGEVNLAPPTWITLYYLSQHTSTQKVLDYLKSQGPMIYETHVAVRGDGVRVAMWNGDAGYQNWNADAEGERHRLIMKKGAFQFEHTSESTKEGLSKPI